ncbi:MAG: transcriptional regulator [Bacteroidetes bacterium GWF2_33_16]|nr:MAG: transcriptional regulator [Bacteroidetes bacterium GWE2_32_14]OFY04190.1 MAG: transcriptional regulator [Bacteroidetes bacterium GWF2_33_16]
MSTCLIINNIRKLRFMANEMTQQELADKTGVTRQTIVAIENGKYSPTLELSFRIAHVFNLPLEEVFSFNYDEDLVLRKGTK